MPRKLFGSLGSPRLKTGTITAIDHASGNSPEIKIPLNSLFNNGNNKSLYSIKYSYDTITDAQFGFRQGLSTVDALFALQGVITKTLSNKNRLYCCFVDYTKAFDTIDRLNIWYKLSKIGICGKLDHSIRRLLMMFVNSLARQLTKLMPRKLFGSLGSPRLKTGTITAIDHASGLQLMDFIQIFSKTKLV
jgi:hypothetical protein